MQLAACGLLPWVEHPFVLAEDGLRIELRGWEALVARIASRSATTVADAVGLDCILRSIGGREKPFAGIYAGLADGRWAFEIRRRTVRPADILVARGDLADIRATVNAGAASAPFDDAYVQEDARGVLNLHHRRLSRLQEVEHVRKRTARLYDRTTILDLARRHLAIGEIIALTGLGPKTVVARAAREGLLDETGFGYERLPANEIFAGHQSIANASGLPPDGQF